MTLLSRLIRFFLPTNLRRVQEVPRHQYELLISIVLFVLGVCLIYGLVYHVFNQPELAKLTFTFAAAFGSPLALIKFTGKWNLSASVGLGVAYLLIVTTTSITGGLNSPAIWWLAILTLGSAVVVGWRAGIIVGMLSIFTVLSMPVLFAFGLRFPDALTYPQRQILIWTNAVAILSATVVFSSVYQRLRDEADRILSEKVQYIEQIMQSLSEMLFVLDRRGRIWQVNKKAVELLAYSQGELFDMPFEQLIFDEEGSVFANKELVGATRKGEVQEYSAHIKAKNIGPFPISLSATIMTDPAGNEHGIIISAKDARESKLIRELKETQIKLVNSGKMAAVGEMAGGVAHEINNPLTIILGQAELLEDLVQEEELDLEQIKTSSASVQETALRIAEIVKGLKMISRDGGLDKHQPARLTDILNSTLAMCRERFKNHGVKLEIDEIDDNIQLHCKSVQLSQVFLNLLNNSYDAISNYDNKWIRLKIEDDKDFVILRFIDCGSGVTESVQRKIFRPFFTTKEVGKGTGLGLSISQSIIKEHGGSLTLDTLSPNTCFVIHLPKTNRQQDAA